MDPIFTIPVPSSFLLPNSAFVIFQRVRLILESPCAGVATTPSGSRFARPPGIWHTVILRTMVYYSDRTEQDQPKEEAHRWRPGETRQKSFRGVPQDALPSSSSELWQHMLCPVPETRCPGFSRGWSHGHLCLAHAHVLAPRGSRFLQRPRGLCQQSNAASSPEVQVPGASRGRPCKQDAVRTAVSDLLR